MKTFQIFLAFGFLTLTSTHAQTFSGGVTGGMVFNNRFYAKPVIVDGVLIYTIPNSLESLKAGGFLDYKLNERLSASFGVSSAFYIGTTGPQIIVRNEQMSNDSLYWSDSYSPSFNTLETSLHVRVKILKFLQPTAGLALATIYNFDKTPRVHLDEQDFDPLIRAEIRRQNYRNNLIYGIDDSYSSAILMSSFGLKLTYRRFFVQVLYEVSITPASEHFQFQGQRHYFQQNMDRMSALAGYRIF